MVRRLLVLVVFCAVVAAGQTKIPVRFSQEPTRIAGVASQVRGGTLFCSLNDLAGLFRLRSSHNLVTEKLEILTGRYTLRVADGNPFVVIFDEQRNGNVIQLQQPVTVSGNAFFVPMEEFVNVFDDVMPEDIRYDRAANAIVIGKTIVNAAFDISGMTFEEKENGYLVRLQSNKKLEDYESWIKPEGNDSWIYTTIMNARVDEAAFRRVPLAGSLKKVLVFQSPKSAQITLKVKGPVSSTELVPADGSSDILLTLHKPSEERVAAARARDYEKQSQTERNKWKLDVVVIDAGHGGDDPGTIGVTKTKEKDVTLGIALKLGKQIQKQIPGVRVVYTRQTDQFIELYRRGQIANQAGGKLFISIHCNAMPHKPNATNGFEIYLLRPGKTENAINLAERENSSVKFEQGYQNRYQELTEENFILLTMAQNAYVKYSEKFAGLLQDEMARKTSLSNNGIKQAGFYVLVGASMPNVLIETAYLSNKKDEKVLKSAAGQQKIAESICLAVKRYKEEYERSLQEGKDLGENRR